MSSDKKTTLIPNTFQTPNAHVDVAMELLTGDEYKVLDYAVRHILGWQDKIAKKKGRISLTMFADGYETADGTRYGGTGLDRKTIQKALTQLVNCGLLVKDGEPTADGQMWTMGDVFDATYLIARRQSRDQINAQRSAKARAAKGAKDEGRLSDNLSPSDNLHPRLSHNLEGRSSHTLNQNHDQNHDQNQKGPTALTDVIKAWIDGQPGFNPANPYKNKTNRTDAAAIVEAGYTPDDVQRFVQVRLREDFWQKRGSVPLRHVRENIGAWLLRNPAPLKPIVSEQSAAPLLSPAAAGVADPDDLIDQLTSKFTRKELAHDTRD